MEKVFRPYPFKRFKSCLPQNLLCPLLNTLSQILLQFFQNRKGSLYTYYMLRTRMKADPKQIFDFNSISVFSLECIFKRLHNHG